MKDHGLSPSLVACLPLLEGDRLPVYQKVKFHGELRRYEAEMIVVGGVLKLVGEWKQVRDVEGER